MYAMNTYAAVISKAHLDADKFGTQAGLSPVSCTVWSALICPALRVSTSKPWSYVSLLFAWYFCHL
jgi:hypothetical protein